MTDKPRAGAGRTHPGSRGGKISAASSRRRQSGTRVELERRAGAKPQAAVVQPLTPRALLALYRFDISEALRALDAPAYRYAQVCEHLLLRPHQPFSQAMVLPTGFRDALDRLGTSTLTLLGSRTAPDGTTKLLLSARDGLCLETVLMRYRDRLTVCLSSQVGCPVGCAFCATGAMGFQRNLTVAEIVDQVRAASVLAGNDGRRVSNLVYMGMGEPLLNLQAILDSIRVVTDPSGLNLAHRAVSVSTVGIPSGIRRLARTEPQVHLALSLHAADDRTRALLVPKGFRHPLSEILDAAWDHFAITHRKLLVEYVLLRGVNDSVDDARRLAGLLHGHVVTVNLLAWNTVSRSPRTAPRRGAKDADTTYRATAGRGESLPDVFEASPPAAIVAFRDALLKARVEAVIRRSKGSGIQAACGQLAGRSRSYELRGDETIPG